MMRWVRLLIVVACVVLLVSLLTWAYVRRPDAGGSVIATPYTVARSNADCRQCHSSVWEEWENSQHAGSWTSPEVQAAFQHFGHDRKCESCHAPVPVFQTGLTSEVAFRGDDRESGVNCLSCHLRADGQVAATRDLPSAPCRPAATPELTTSRSCGVCHDAIFKDWESTDLAAQGKTCQSCHMPADEARANGRSHLCLGGHDPATVRSAVKLECVVEADQLHVRVHNHNGGHNFPGERHNRILLVEVVERDRDQEITLARQEVIKGITPFRGESTAEKIRYGDLWQASFPIVQPAVQARVRLIYKLFPWYSDAEQLVVDEREVPLP